MAFTPDTDINLLSVNIDATYVNQITFSSEYNQANYFLGKTVYSASNLTYQRRDNTIMWPSHIDNLYQCNYCMYRNSNFTNKWFYAFITNMSYVNDNTTAVTIQTDVWQTWYFSIDIRECFVEREHVNDDRVGSSLTPEGLETGDYIINGPAAEIDLGEMMIILTLSANPDETPTGGELFDGVFTGLEYLFFNADDTGVAQLNSIIQGYADLAKLDAITAIFMCPKRFRSSTSTQYDIAVKQSDLDGYMPKNKKLYCAPYTMFGVTNFNGGFAQYKPEDFTAIREGDTTISFMLRTALSMQPAATFYPLYFKYAAANIDEGLTLTGFPQCSWRNDVFSQWLAQTESNRNQGVINSVFSAVTGAYTGNMSSLISGVNGVFAKVGEVYQHSLMPTQIAGQINCQSANVTWDRMKFGFRQYSISREFAEKIDNFFSMFGYAAGKVKIPNITGRPNWNYVKTVDVNILGAIPNDDIETLKNMFNRGVTFWHNGDIIGNYSLPNEIGSDPEPPPDPPPEPEPSEDFYSPVGGEWQNAVTSEFGWRDFPPDPYHTGIDLNIQYGLDSPIFCVLDGVVQNVINSSTGFGKHVYIDHGEGLVTLYGHCNSISVTTGQTVTRGSEIARIGQTGLATGPHLHFQVNVNGVPVNPRHYLMRGDMF